MTQKKATSPKAAPKPVEPAQGAIDVGGLPDFQHAQVSEALAEERTFATRDGSEFTFKPQEDWSYRCEQAAARGDIPTWARGALKDPGQADDLLDAPGRDVGRILQFFIDQSGVSRGEGSSSSES
ncbi:hypothetical protein F4561_002663 [Lipingzhangella halophila]|uniref:Tail assembly chaperone n=1 Tax=Lipingzhangella halophila TaxID=1783352 RepID=A0A7W7W2W0_9ACTN|nr:hypothetical protein [Lipingzhangella halophila]MBB4931843.1 hypothetical protein [Lipingzhangella halophila]